MSDTEEAFKPEIEEAGDETPAAEVAATNEPCQLRKEPNLLIEDIVSSFACNDTKIVCQSSEDDGKLTQVPASSLMLSMASNFLKDEFGEVLEKTLRVDDESFVIILPDFDEATVRGMIECMATGDFCCQSEAKYFQLDCLLSAVCLNRGHVDYKPRKKKSRKQELRTREEKPVIDEEQHQEDYYDDVTYDYTGMENDDVMKSEPDQYNSDYENDEFPQVKVELDVDNSKEICVEDSSSSSPKNRFRKRKAADDGEGGGGESNGLSAIKREMLMREHHDTSCPVCKFDDGTYESQAKHVEELVPDYKIPALTTRSRGRHYCPICLKDIFNTFRLRIHFRIHMEEAHNQEKECKPCGDAYETTAEYLAHQKKHRAMKNKHLGDWPEKKEETDCPVCGLDDGTFESMAKHCEELIGDPSFKIPPLKPRTRGRHYCPICNRDIYNTLKLRSHFRVHLEEAHNKELDCAVCGNSFTTPTNFMMHQRKHRAMKQRLQTSSFEWPIKGERLETCCPVCGLDDGTFESMAKHLEELIGDPDFKIPPLATRTRGRHYCPICLKDIFNTHKLRLHFTEHLEEAHDQQKECVPCGITFDTTTLYMSHQRKHRSMKARQQQTGCTETKRQQEETCCPVCRTDDGTYESMARHVEELLADYNYKVPPLVTRTRGRHYCPICSKDVHNNYRLRLHFTVHLEEAHNQQRECHYCQIPFDTPALYFEHQKKHRAMKARQQRLEEKECETCHKKFALQSWHGHVKSCTRRATKNFLMCDKCDYKTVHPEALRGHYASFHGGEMRFSCPVCNKKFFKKSVMLQHHRDYHTNEANHMCDQCGKSFTRAAQIQEHKKHVHNNKFFYECTHCLQKFKNKNHANRHVVMHTDLDAYECSICHERFKNNAAAYTHRKQRHNNEGQALVVKEEEHVQVRNSLVRKIVDPTAAHTDRSFKRFRGSVAANHVPIPIMALKEQQQQEEQDSISSM